MTCRYCGSHNSEDDHRCRRCGRRIDGGASAIPFTREATARALDPEPVRPPAPAPPPEAPAPGQPLYQRSLFVQRESLRLVEPPPAPQVRARRPRAASSAPAIPPPAVSQQRLDFAVPSTHSARAAGPVSHIVCDAITARVSTRVAAFVGDSTVVLVSIAVCVAAVRAVLGTLPLRAPALTDLGVAAFLIAALYKTLWCLANADSPGMRWARLRLVTFEGRRPTRAQRFRRATAFLLSFAAIGVGLAWAALDEDGLGWHDSISSTFPTED